MKTAIHPAPSTGTILVRDAPSPSIDRAVVLAVSKDGYKTEPGPGIPWALLAKVWRSGNESQTSIAVITCYEVGQPNEPGARWYHDPTGPIGSPTKKLMGTSERRVLGAVLEILRTHGDADTIANCLVDRGIARSRYGTRLGLRKGVIVALGALVRAGRAFKGNPANVGRWGLSQEQADKRATVANAEQRIVTKIVTAARREPVLIAAHGTEHVSEKLTHRLRSTLGWGLSPIVFGPWHFRPPAVSTKPKVPDSPFLVLWLDRVKLTKRVVDHVNEIVAVAHAQPPRASVILLAHPTTDLSPLGWPVFDPPDVSLLP